MAMAMRALLWLAVCLACLVLRCPGQAADGARALTPLEPPLCLVSSALVQSGHCPPRFPTKSRQPYDFPFYGPKESLVEVEEALIMQKVASQVLKSLKGLIRNTSALTRISGDTFAGVLSSFVRGVGGACNLFAEVLRAFALGLQAHYSSVSTNATAAAAFSAHPQLRALSYKLSIYLLRVAGVLNTLSSIYVWGGEITESFTSGFGEALEDSFQGLEFVVGSGDVLVMFLLNEKMRVRGQHALAGDPEPLAAPTASASDSGHPAPTSAGGTTAEASSTSSTTSEAPVESAANHSHIREESASPRPPQADQEPEPQLAWEHLFSAARSVLAALLALVIPLARRAHALAQVHCPALLSLLEYARGQLPPLIIEAPSASLVLLPHCLVLCLFVYAASYSLRSLVLLLYVLLWLQHALHRLVTLTSMHALHARIHESSFDPLPSLETQSSGMPGQFDKVRWVNSLVSALWEIDGGVGDPMPTELFSYVHVFEDLQAHQPRAGNLSTWLFARGGLGPYMSFVFRELLEEQLALLPPSVANARLKSFSLGSRPPLLHGVNVTRQRNGSCSLSHAHSSAGRLRAERAAGGLQFVSDLLDRYFPRNRSVDLQLPGASDQQPWSPCEVLTVSLDFVFIAQGLDVTLTLRPLETKNALLPEMTAVVPRVALQGRLCFNVSLSPDFPFLDVAEMYFSEVPSLDFSVSSLGGLELSSIPPIYSHLSAAATYLLGQFTAPFVTSLDVRHLMCTSCDAAPVPSVKDHALAYTTSVLAEVRAWLRAALERPASLVPWARDELWRVRERGAALLKRYFRRRPRPHVLLAAGAG